MKFKTLIGALLLLAAPAFAQPFAIPTAPAGSSVFARQATNASGSTTLTRLAPDTEWIMQVTGASGARTAILGTSGAVQGNHFTARFEFPNSYAGDIALLNSTSGGLSLGTVSADGTGTAVQRSFIYDGTKWVNFTPDDTGGGGGSGTVTVVGGGSLTSTALMTGGGGQTAQTPAA